MFHKGILVQTMTSINPSARIQKIVPFILLGFGFILINSSAYFILRNKPPQADLSAVPVKVNYPAPELTLTDTQGISHSLAEYRGQVVLINLWATWCEPCKKEMPALQAFYDAHQPADGFVTLAINDGEPREDVLRFAEELELTFPIWLDPTSIATAQAFKTIGLPTSFVIDRSGAVRFYWVGAIDQETLEATISPILLEEK